MAVVPLTPQEFIRRDTRADSIWYARVSMLFIFIVLVVQQIVQGVYSLWQGFQWLAMVRRRLGSHAGFYAPRVAVICPCKGAELNLEANLAALARFEFVTYELFFTLATKTDPALKIIERVKAAYPQHPIHIVIAGASEDTGEKVSNLRKAVEQVPEDFEVLVFVDSDITVGRSWLTKMVSPLGDSRVGAATTYRWMIPAHVPGKSDLASALGSAWNASVATMLGEHSRNFCWGGGTAIRRATFDHINAMHFWLGSVSDDLALTNALEQANLPILFVPECMAATSFAVTFPELIEFTNRQVILTRVYSERMWTAALAAHTSYVVTALFSIYVVVSEMTAGFPFVQLLLMALLVPLLAAMKGALRTVAIEELLPEWKRKLRQWSWVWTGLAPVVPFLYFWNFCVSLVSKTIRWRGIRYRLISTNQLQVVRR